MKLVSSGCAACKPQQQAPTTLGFKHNNLMELHTAPASPAMMPGEGRARAAPWVCVSQLTNILSQLSGVIEFCVADVNILLEIILGRTLLDYVNEITNH